MTTNSSNEGPDSDKVICPNCVHQFRAIPVNVQHMLRVAGYEPPFYTAQPTAQSSLSKFVRSTPAEREQQAAGLAEAASARQMAGQPTAQEPIPLEELDWLVGEVREHGGLFFDAERKRIWNGPAMAGLLGRYAAALRAALSASGPEAREAGTPRAGVDGLQRGTGEK